VSKYVLANTLRVGQKDFLKKLDGTGRFVRKQMVAQLLETEGFDTLHAYLMLKDKYVFS
jgi:hypothetical protein